MSKLMLNLPYLLIIRCPLRNFLQLLCNLRDSITPIPFQYIIVTQSLDSHRHLIIFYIHSNIDPKFLPYIFILKECPNIINSNTIRSSYFIYQLLLFSARSINYSTLKSSVSIKTDLAQLNFSAISLACSSSY